ncbi:MAG: MATE family efflux transporter, partial [Clostridium sp.]
MRQERDLTKGAIVKSLWLFALPLMLGNVLQQFYNLVDTWVVGRYLGKRALAAVGASYTLMTFLTSVVIGLCLGAGAFFSMAYGRREKETFRNGIFMSFTAIGSLSIVLTILLYGFVRPLTYLLQVPAETVEDMVTYLIYVFAGFFAIFLYNYFASVLRSIGNSVLPLVFLGISVALNIGLDLLFVVTFSFVQLLPGCSPWQYVISQYAAGIGLMLYFLFRYSDLCPAKKDFTWEKKNFRQILSLSGFTCLQQSVMNFGILMIQGLVNSFGTTIMAAFSVAVKIDTIAYMPVQDFGNAFSFFVAQITGQRVCQVLSIPFVVVCLTLAIRNL